MSRLYLMYMLFVVLAAGFGLQRAASSAPPPDPAATAGQQLHGAAGQGEALSEAAGGEMGIRAAPPAVPDPSVARHRFRVHLIVLLDNSRSLRPWAKAVRMRQPLVFRGGLLPGDRLDVLAHGEHVRSLVGQDLLSEAEVRDVLGKAQKAPLNLDAAWTSLKAPLERAIVLHRQYGGNDVATVVVWTTDGLSSFPSRDRTERDWDQALKLAARLREMPRTTTVLLGVNSGPDASLALPALAAALGATHLPIDGRATPDRTIAQALERVREVVEVQRQDVPAPAPAVTAAPATGRQDAWPEHVGRFLPAASLALIGIVGFLIWLRRRPVRENAIRFPAPITPVAPVLPSVPPIPVSIALFQQPLRRSTGSVPILVGQPLFRTIPADGTAPTVVTAGSGGRDSLHINELPPGFLVLKLEPTRLLLSVAGGPPVTVVQTAESAETAGGRTQDRRDCGRGDHVLRWPCRIEFGRYRLVVKPGISTTRVASPPTNAVRSTTSGVRR
jgi:hypothetical protein